jgi:hypothetical protein
MKAGQESMRRWSKIIFPVRNAPASDDGGKVRQPSGARDIPNWLRSVGGQYIVSSPYLELYLHSITIGGSFGDKVGWQIWTVGRVL